MITIPTCELIGASKDALQFTAPEKDFPEFARIQFAWDGETLHVTATNIITDCHGTWDPVSDDYDGDDRWEATGWGGADDPWTVVVSAEHVKHMAKSFDVATKLARCPLTMEVDRARLLVKRSHDTGLSEAAHRYTGSLDPFPDVEKQIADAGLPHPVEVVHVGGPGALAVAQVAKRRGCGVRWVPRETAVTATVGDRFTAAVRTGVPTGML